ncbi:DUF2806 domain-containing protein [Hymenobacter profundi]|uniref:DUF2806 domain-containing protein n=1 Tax=Hymenobacter profundi TaxID=1982110 RepID=A0ABS6WYH3_9BACT|nr:DUF2806 domain-containing protein [Hymenobacter profundi]
MQQLWSQILAGEVNKQGSFSIRTINLLSSLSIKDALLFRKLCTFILSITIIDNNSTDSYVLLDIRDINKPPFNISFSEIIHLESIYFISLNISTGYILRKHEIKINYNGQVLNIRTRLNNEPSISIGDVALTSIGKELSLIVKPEIDYNILNYWEKYYIDKDYDVSK